MEDRFRLENFELYQAAGHFRKGLYRILKTLPPARREVLFGGTNEAGGHLGYEQHR
jgi:hypothetical protein